MKFYYIKYFVILNKQLKNIIIGFSKYTVKFLRLDDNKTFTKW